MAEDKSGLLYGLGFARIYELFQTLVGVHRVRCMLADRLRMQPGQRLLDIGCGPARILEYLPEDIQYFGFDISERYIDAARRRHPDRGQFWVERVSRSTLDRVPPCDAVLACGLIHHLDDDEATGLFQRAAEALVPHGRLITYDPCFHEGMPWLARLLVSRDRGQNVRQPEEYAALARPWFGDVSIDLHQGHLRIPYSCAVLKCSEPTVAKRAGNQ